MRLFARLPAVAALLILLALPAGLAAQTERLEGRVDRATLDAVTELVAAARADGLPTGPLVNKALEGASKRADGERIVAAVRALAVHLADARRALGASPSEAELVAGAAALRAGVSPDYLARLRRGQPGRPMVVPLAVMADLVARGVPADTAARAVLDFARAGARDEELVAFRQSVERDIALGAPAGASASVRVTTGRAALTFGDATSAPSTTPPSGPRRP